MEYSTSRGKKKFIGLAPHSVAAGILVCFLLGSCPAVFGTQFEYPDSQPPASSRGEICILDPTASIAEAAEQPPPVAADSPQVVIPEMSHDFGKITGANELTHKFQIKNAGKSVLNIKRVVPG